MSNVFLNDKTTGNVAIPCYHFRIVASTSTVTLVDGIIFALNGAGTRTLQLRWLDTYSRPVITCYQSDAGKVYLTDTEGYPVIFRPNGINDIYKTTIPQGSRFRIVPSIADNLSKVGTLEVTIT